MQKSACHLLIEFEGISLSGASSFRGRHTVRTVVTLAVIGITLASCSSPTPDSQTKDAGGKRDVLK